MEWVGTMLLVALMGTASLAVAPMVDGRSFGGFLTHRIVCAVRSGGCHDGDAALMASYGARTASLVREHAPGLVYEPGERELPVDYRRCRDPECADTPDDPDLDAHRSAAGARSTVFTRVVRRGGRTYIQYWFYYPDSNSTWAGSDRIWKSSALLKAAGWILRGTTAYPGFHWDDWEGYQVRIDADGRALGPGHGARPLPGVQAEALPQPLDSPDGLDPRLTREPRRAHPGAAALAGAPPARPGSPGAVSGIPARCCPARICTNAPRARRG